jgi:translation initiation factor 1
MSQNDNRRVVYTSDGGAVRFCRRCGALEHAGRCHTAPADAGGGTQTRRLPNDGVVRLARDRKGRGGKTVTLIAGLPGDEAALAALAQTLKRLCGTGGTVKDGVVEIQGEHRERLAAYLAGQGYRVKIAGG